MWVELQTCSVIINTHTNILTHININAHTCWMCNLTSCVAVAAWAACQFILLLLLLSLYGALSISWLIITGDSSRSLVVTFFTSYTFFPFFSILFCYSFFFWSINSYAFCRMNGRSSILQFIDNKNWCIDIRLGTKKKIYGWLINIRHW